MGHKGSIEAKYTTNKGILPKTLMEEMRDAFKRSEKFLDLEKTGEDPLEKEKEEVRAKIESMSHDEIAKVLEFLKNGNTSSESSQPMMQRSSSTKDGSTSELCQMEGRRQNVPGHYVRAGLVV
ncbi:MAG: hypothetical protein ACK4TO_00315 [Candidatus Nitrosotenuis sp.]